MDQYQMLINGQLTGSRTGRTFKSFSPENNEPHAELPHASIEDASAAVNAARRAFDQGVWSDMEGSLRAEVLLKLANLLEEQQEEFCQAEAKDQGKPIGFTRLLEFPLVLDCFRYYAGWADKIYGQTIPVPAEGLDFTLREPVGVCVAFPANNYPLAMAAWKIAPALAVGNSVVLRPSPHTSVSTAMLGVLCQEAGFPDGVVNIVTEPGIEVASYLAMHSEVDLVALTGGTETGRKVLQSTATGLKRTLMELGGKSPMIVLPDAELDEVVTGALNGAFFNCGQTCTAATRILVHTDIAHEFLENLLQRMTGISVGPPLSEDTQMGPMVSSQQLEKVRSYLKVGSDEGAKLIQGGDTPSGDGLDPRGNYITPALFTEVNNEMRVAREEIFGPVACIIRFEDENAAYEQANDSIYGLSASVWSRDIKRALSAARKLRAGTVWINNHNMFFNQAPFGGYKQSGFGRENGSEVLLHYTQTKNVYVELSDAILSAF